MTPHPAFVRVRPEGRVLDVPGRGARKSGEATSPSQMSETSQNVVRSAKTRPIVHASGGRVIRDALISFPTHVSLVADSSEY